MTSSLKKFLLPTPAGAFYLTQDNSESWEKTILKKLFSKSHAMEVTKTSLQNLLMTTSDTETKEKLNKCEYLKIIQVIDKKLNAPEGDFEDNLNQLIRYFSDKEKVLLSDTQGLCIANYGFPTEMLEEISVLSADIAIMHKRRAQNINNKLGINSQAWSIVDASGHSNLGFWPININKEIFVLAIEGVPFFNQDSMVSLVWMLYLRYGK